jgi:hypothetical protein
MAYVVTSPMYAAAVEINNTNGIDRSGDVIATAAAAPTTAPVGTIGMMDPSSTPKNSTG